MRMSRMMGWNIWICVDEPYFVRDKKKGWIG